VVHIVHSGVSEEQNVDVPIFRLGWERYGFDKKRVGKHCAKLVFLHPVGSVGRIVHFGASGA
jgi:hypothetical protein